MEKSEIDLAKVGLIALVDEATGYQYVRPPDELRRKLKDLKNDEYRIIRAGKQR